MEKERVYKIIGALSNGFLVEDVDGNGIDLIDIFEEGFKAEITKDGFLICKPEVKKPVKVKNAYLANGLFSLSDRLFNNLLAKEIRNNITINLYVPQENNAINDKSAYADSKDIFKADYEKLKESDFVIAIIDGVEVDSGVAAEIGVASTLGKKIYCLYTDSRQQGIDNEQKINALRNDVTENQFMYRNLFLIGLIKENGYIFNNIDSLIEQLKADINK